MTVLIVVLRIGKLVRECKDNETPFSMETILHQSDSWLNNAIAIREAMPRNMPPTEKYKNNKQDKPGEYSSWGWDRQCDLAYVQAIWELGMNQKVNPFQARGIIIDKRKR